MTAKLMNGRSALLVGSLAAIGGYCAYIQKVEKRSVRSKMAEITIGKSPAKNVMSDPDKFNWFIQEKREKSYTSYSIPISMKMKADVRKTKTDGMPVYSVRSHTRPATVNSHKRHVFYIPGGGYVMQPHKRHWRFLRKLAKEAGWDSTVPIYPTVPNHTYEESFRKVLAQYKKLLLEVPAEKIVLMGDSAGGGFALAIAQQLKKEGLPQPGDLVLLSPWLDASMSDPRQIELEKIDPYLSRYGLKKLGDLWAGPRGDSGNPFVSPINGDLRGLAQITVLTGTHTLLLTDARNLKDRMARAGVDIQYYEYPKMTHGFMLYPLIPEADAAVNQLISAVNRQ
ncbi:alpha/beta hydrolase [Metaplanococcus flavidus]|uniref:Alpha/beta hydrolase n=1 Tax=Metaplanococcus flavidus TaxID=569883 RepID=A0ABW3LF34_9BACL